MDDLKKPLRIPSGFSRYAEEKGVFQLYERMLEELLVEKPVDPLSFLHEFLCQRREGGEQHYYSLLECADILGEVPAV